MMQPCIYIIENAAVPSKVYIGSAVDFKHRCGAHMRLLALGRHHSIKLQRSYAKHGVENFSIRPLLYCERKDLLYYEQRAIDMYDAARKGYNMNPTAGSNAGRIWSPEVRARMSVAKKGVLQTKSGNTRKGRIASKEHCERISTALKGKTKSTEHCTKISASKLGNKASPETKAKMSAARVGKKQSPESIAKRIATVAALRQAGVIFFKPKKSELNGRFVKTTDIKDASSKTVTTTLDAP